MLTGVHLQPERYGCAEDDASMKRAVEDPEDGNSYSGGEADGELDASAPHRAHMHRRSLSGSVILDEQAWRSQSPGRRLTPSTSARRSATIRFAATSPGQAKGGALQPVSSPATLLRWLLCMCA